MQRQMKIKRYLAADMRSALRAVREEQGSDAVILSSRATPQGVEVCAAVDLELAAGQGTLAETAELKQLERSAWQELELTEAKPAPCQRPRQRSANRDSHYAANADAELAVMLAAAEPAGADRSVGEELRSLRTLLEQQLAALAWNDFTRREPLKARALADLANAWPGPRAGTADRRRAARGHRQRAAAAHALCDAGASHSSVRRAAGAQRGAAAGGAAGRRQDHDAVEACRALRARAGRGQPAADLADDERIGSHEQLRGLGRLLGVRVEAVVGSKALAARIEALPGRMMLIDTPGVPSRDRNAAAQYRALRQRCTALQTMLVLPASAQGGVVDDAVTISASVCRTAARSPASTRR
jgi:flagellar biosynthesis protein FlhF